jgi:type I site-specific restriction-modification system R (restriction) subunit
MAALGLDMRPHRLRMVKEDLATKFKDPDDPFRLVFVCAMWMTGFDAPACSTIYLDKPMRAHTLMQTIARANRVTSWKIDGVEKKNGEIIDYYNVFRNMRKALRDYAQGDEGKGDMPVREKKELFTLLDDSIAQGIAFCAGLGIDLTNLLESRDVFKNVGTFEDYANQLLAKDEWWKGYAVYENTITSLYEACKPEILGKPVVRSVAVFQYLRGVLDAIIDQYNAGSSSADQFFDELVKFARGLKKESERHVREGLTEDELELFDLLKKPKMTKAETQKVRLAAKALLHRLCDESPKVLVQDWFKDTQSRGRVRSTVEAVLHDELPESYDRTVFTEKCNNVLDLMTDYASKGLKWVA